MLEIIIIILVVYGLVSLISWFGSILPETKSAEGKRIETFLEKRRLERNIKSIRLPITEGHFYPQLTISEYDYGTYSRASSKTNKFVYEHNRGISEEGFKEFLDKYFSELFVRWNSEIIEGFIPDFTIKDSNFLKVAIEIDEPYTFKEKKPTHYITSADFHRSINISNRGWSIVRFTEKQIVTQPINCCKFIGLVIDYLLLTDTYSKVFFGISNVKSDKVWTFEEATEMALGNYRKTYLYLNRVKYMEGD